jgi:prolycopene isomerase
MHMGLRGISEDTLRRVHGYHWDGWDPDEVGRGSLRFKLFAPTLYDPSLAPAGGQVLIVQKVLDMDYASVVNWGAHKAAIEQIVTERLRQLVPDIESKIVVRMSASAATSQRYTLNHEGAMLGWEMSPDQLGPHRPQIESPLEDLFFVGHWTQPGGGITPVLISAVLAAERIAPPSRPARPLEVESGTATESVMVGGELTPV